jgi:hypothetical protein
VQPVHQWLNDPGFDREDLLDNDQQHDDQDEIHDEREYDGEVLKGVKDVLEANHLTPFAATVRRVCRRVPMIAFPA